MTNRISNCCWDHPEDINDDMCEKLSKKYNCHAKCRGIPDWLCEKWVDKGILKDVWKDKYNKSVDLIDDMLKFYNNESEGYTKVDEKY
jgi:hypothetical protein